MNGARHLDIVVVRMLLGSDAGVDVHCFLANCFLPTNRTNTCYRMIRMLYTTQGGHGRAMHCRRGLRAEDRVLTQH